MEFHYQHNGQNHTLLLEAQPDGSYRAQIGEESYRVEIIRHAGSEFSLAINGRHVRAQVARRESGASGETVACVALLGQPVRSYEFTRANAGASRRQAARSGEGNLSAQMPGQVMEVLVAEGDPVEQGQTLIILEAMKMEMKVISPYAGVVTRLTVRAGDQVERGQQLIDINKGTDE